MMKARSPIVLLALGLWLLAGGCLSEGNEGVSLRSLLDELSPEADASLMPSQLWAAHVSSGEIAAEAVTAVLLDARGPGAVSRMHLSAADRRGRLLIFFDGAASADIEIPAFAVNIPDMPEGFADGEATSRLPLPYSRSCRIVYEAPADAAERGPKSYHIDYRNYPQRTRVETFSPRALISLRKKTARIAQLLAAPEAPADTQRISGSVSLGSGEPIVINLPAGQYAVSELSLRVAALSGSYEQVMRDIILQSVFDGLHTMRLPLSDFSGGGMTAGSVSSCMLSADGQGSLTSRWLMPYQEEASIALINEGSSRIRISYAVTLGPRAWNERSLYFNASWREVLAGDKDSVVLDIRGGPGVFKGEAFTLYNYTSRSAWLTDGLIEAEADGATLFAARGLDGYYNTPAGGPSVRQTPFGGMIRSGGANTHGYNSLLRLRALDGIAFENSLRMTYSLPAGRTDYAVVSYWYGSNKTRAAGFSAPVFQSRTLLPAPAEGAGGED
ncbi:MAG: DUF2961 domain-containing protein [Tannerellaceae bacterium]|jgi:hypothetical protein|nr:DUF2961 domain-containing protein [Tannerellaceae bacterium]